jgi:hypothetical protein
MTREWTRKAYDKPTKEDDGAGGRELQEWTEGLSVQKTDNRQQLNVWQRQAATGNESVNGAKNDVWQRADNRQAGDPPESSIYQVVSL